MSECPDTIRVPVVYRNWRGEVKARVIEPLRIWHGACEPWHPTLGYLLTVREHSTGKIREFAMSGVLAWGEAGLLEHQQQTAAVRTLTAAGWTYTQGAIAWKPPLGPAPEFEAHDRRQELALDLRRICDEGMIGAADTAVIAAAADALAAVRLLNVTRAEVQERLSRIEALFAEDRSSRGLPPSGRLEDQVIDALARARKVG